MRTLTLFSAMPVAILILAFFCPNANAQTQLPVEIQQKIDKVAHDALAKTGVPSASVAVVKDGQIAYLHAYGNARLEPETPAKPEMRYSIGSVSKQFTAAAILLLQEQGKLSLDDKVSKFIPGLTRANEVTIRQLLSHTSGYQDYWPQDYVMPMMLQPVDARKILDTWGRKPLDFDPGTKWQYSNTNYVIAGLIVEKVSGEPLLQFLQQEIFIPLKMKSVADTDKAKLGDTDPTGYMRYALGPPRPAPKEGSGWLFAAGELAMPAEDLAKWDISIINEALLKPASYREFRNRGAAQEWLGDALRPRRGRKFAARPSFVIPRAVRFRVLRPIILYFQTSALPWLCSQTRTPPKPRERSPWASRRCCWLATTLRRRRNLHKRARFSKGYSTARLIVRFSPTTPISISMNRR